MLCPTFTQMKNRILSRFANRPHRRHHDGKDEFAHGDFLVVLVPVIVVMSSVCAAYIILQWSGIAVPRLYLYVVLAATLGHLVLSYLMHMSYHVRRHVLDNFAWYRKCRRLHELHHEYPDSNFGICTFVCDAAFGTLRCDP